MGLLYPKFHRFPYKLLQKCLEKFRNFFKDFKKISRECSENFFCIPLQNPEGIPSEIPPAIAYEVNLGFFPGIPSKPHPGLKKNFFWSTCDNCIKRRGELLWKLFRQHLQELFRWFLWEILWQLWFPWKVLR